MDAIQVAMAQSLQSEADRKTGVAALGVLLFVVFAVVVVWVAVVFWPVAVVVAGGWALFGVARKVLGPSRA